MKQYLLTWTSLLLSTMYLNTGCSTSSPVVNRPSGGNMSSRVVEVTLQNECPLEKTSWLVAETQFNEKQQSTLAKQLASAALVDADKAKSMQGSHASILQLTSALQQFIDSTNEQKQIVSPDFYKEYINNRNSLCTILEAIRRGSIKKEETHKTTETAFRKIAHSFEKFITISE